MLSHLREMLVLVLFAQQYSQQQKMLFCNKLLSPLRACNVSLSFVFLEDAGISKCLSFLMANARFSMEYSPLGTACSNVDTGEASSSCLQKPSL